MLGYAVSQTGLILSRIKIWGAGRSFGITVYVCCSRHDCSTAGVLHDNDWGLVIIAKCIVGGRYVHTVCGILDVHKTHAVQLCKEVQICMWYH